MGASSLFRESNRRVLRLLASRGRCTGGPQPLHQMAVTRIVRSGPSPSRSAASRPPSPCTAGRRTSRAVSYMRDRGVVTSTGGGYKLVMVVTRTWHAASLDMPTHSPWYQPSQLSQPTCQVRQEAGGVSTNDAKWANDGNWAPHYDSSAVLTMNEPSSTRPLAQLSMQ